MIGVFLYKMDNTQLTFVKFKNYASKCETVPVYKSILTDLLTSVSSWVHLSQKTQYPFLLKSAEEGNHYSRYSYLSINLKKIYSIKMVVPLSLKMGNAQGSIVIESV